MREFDPEFYLSQNPDVRAAGIDPLLHFNIFGYSEGRDPNIFFDTQYYLLHNPDVASAGVNAFAHFNSYGIHEGRNPDAFFNVNYYVQNNPDIAASGIDPLLHYITYGGREGRSPGAFFDSRYYLSHNSDVQHSGINPLYHFLTYGVKELRNPNSNFHMAEYAAANAEIRASILQGNFVALHHILDRGVVHQVNLLVAGGQSVAEAQINGATGVRAVLPPVNRNSDGNNDSGITIHRLDLSDLDGSNGFTVGGLSAHMHLGYAVSNAGDINGDGIDDILLGAPQVRYDNSITIGTGYSYVIFGKTSSFSTSFDLSALNGSNGFVLNGCVNNDYAGISVSNAGDVNGDGIGDLIIGADLADPNHNSLSGQAYVVFGKTDFSGTSGALDLSSLDGSTGFAINGTTASDQLGFSVGSVGDFNGDGYDDVVMGANNYSSLTGRAYVLFGKADFSATMGSFNISSLDGSNGFYITGDAGGQLGVSVSSAGDINGDGLDDLIVGANIADPNSTTNAGKTYVIFGTSATLGSADPYDLTNLNGTNGFMINGENVDSRSGRSVYSAGDINHDGYDDLVIGAIEDNTVSGGSEGAGSAYVVFGKSDFSTTSGSFNLADLDGTNGFKVTGVNDYDETGFAVSSAGDVNGDGVDDFIIGTYSTASSPDAGHAYVLYGKTTAFDATIDLSTLSASDGFIIDGITDGDHAGRSVSGGGDINGDGFDDLIVGANNAAPNGSNSGQAYVIYGSNLTESVNVLGTSASNTLAGSASADTIIAGQGDDVVTGGAGNDYIKGAAGDDSINGGDNNDLLLGGAGTDTLIGGEGDDTLIGGMGADVLTGGNGADMFRFDKTAESGVQGDVNSHVWYVDAIQDFVVGTDKIAADIGTASFSVGDNSASATYDDSIVGGVGGNGTTLHVMADIFMLEYDGESGLANLDEQGEFAAIKYDLTGDNIIDGTMIFLRVASDSAIAGDGSDYIKFLIVALVGVTDPTTITAADFVDL